MAISHQKTPPNGWRYKEAKTNTTLVATDFNTLVKAVTDHRKSNGIDVWYPEQDIEEQIEKNFPHLAFP